MYSESVYHSTVFIMCMSAYNTGKTFCIMKSEKPISQSSNGSNKEKKKICMLH
jgi:hypothetical protein